MTTHPRKHTETISFSTTKSIKEMLETQWQEKGFASRSEYLNYLIGEAGTIDRAKEKLKYDRDRKKKKRDEARRMSVESSVEPSGELTVTNEGAGVPIMSGELSSEHSADATPKVPRTTRRKQDEPYTYEGKLNVGDAAFHYRIKHMGVFRLQEIHHYTTIMDDRLMLYAMEQGTGKSAAYLLGILHDWSTDGYKTLEDHPHFRSRGNPNGMGESDGRTNRGSANRTSTQPPEIIPEKAGWRGRSADS